MKITKAVFPVAGLGSRFLPATKANPKEMLPIIDKPLIQYGVEEAIRAGISHIIFITSSNKRAIEDHFDRNIELERLLQEQDKMGLLELVKNVSPQNVQFTYVRQPQPLGLGDAITRAQHVVGDEPFAVLLADDLIDDTKTPCLSSMMEHFEKNGRSIIAVQSVPWSDISRYGIVQINDTFESFAPIQLMVEKPKPNTIPSNLAAIGRYVFTSDIFSCLKKIKQDNNGEFQLTDAIRNLLTQEPVFAYKFSGDRYDCGEKFSYLCSMVKMAKKHPEIGQAFSDFLNNKEYL